MLENKRDLIAIGIQENVEVPERLEEHNEILKELWPKGDKAQLYSFVPTNNGLNMYRSKRKSQ